MCEKCINKKINLNYKKITIEWNWKYFFGSRDRTERMEGNGANIKRNGCLNSFE